MLNQSGKSYETDDMYVSTVPMVESGTDLEKPMIEIALGVATDKYTL